MANTDFSTVTEIAGCNVTSEQLQRMYTRYRFALDYCAGKDVLEVACGTGQGLGYIAKKANKVVGGDYDVNIVKQAQAHYGDRVTITRVDAQQLPFDNRSFDVVLCYEAIYYFEHPERFVGEARRVLRDGGILIICTANKDWLGFNPSPYSYRYFSAPELHGLLTQHGFQTALFADCPVRSESFSSSVISRLKQVAVKLHLIPKTMRGKELLKRLFMGKLKPMPAEVDDEMAVYTPPVPIQSELANTQFKVLFAVGHAD